ncbi:MAG: 1-deoxy-D-xylulose-5-phosphate reductoisomerase [Lachnospiraceae bacterium]|nr:1-deoxy-D-xylulose-5-phosphate reductoisomerase [Lachnospiraceae bacterium]
MKKISILGSTGSIGTQTLDIVRINKDIKVVGLSANSNVDLLLKQIEEFEPELVCVFREDKACELKERLKSLNTVKLPEVVSGMEGLISCAVIPSAEMVVTAFVGMIGIRPTIEAIKSGKDIALANKETLVTAGHIIMPLAKENNVRILPVDSEHSAIFQCLNGESVNKIEKILLTASGGPFRGKTLADLKNVTLADALKHPNWSMGKKITIDSSTMVNKGLEVMEAGWLFGVDLDDIQVVIQPKSIIHSMVQFKDGCVMAQLGLPDMRAPISYALYYPERRYIDGRSLDFWDLKSIEFDRPDPDTFKGLSLALRAGKEGGSMPTVFNAANEKAVSLFLNEKIGYLTITEIIEEMMDKIPVIKNPSLDEILETEKEVYTKIDESRGF